MNKNNAMLMLILPEVVSLIMRNHKLSETEATDALYNSKLFSILEDEELKLWHYSPQTLYKMYDGEVRTGKITFPEGV